MQSTGTISWDLQRIIYVKLSQIPISALKEVVQVKILAHGGQRQVIIAHHEVR